MRIVAALCLFLTASVAHAQSSGGAAALADPAPPISHDASQFALDITAFTMLPLAIGGAVALEMPGHVVLRFGAGAVPSAYVDAINDVGTGAHAWDESQAAIASTLLAGATTLELDLAIRPAGTPGIELSVGYLLLWSHRTAGMSLVGGSGDRVLGLDLSIHAVHAELAWQTELVDHFYLRFALGWAHAFARQVSLTTEAPDEAMQQTLAQAESSLSSAVGSHAFGPTVSLALGVRL